MSGLGQVLIRSKSLQSSGKSSRRGSRGPGGMFSQKGAGSGSGARSATPKATDIANALRKNKEYLQLKREMDQKSRQKRKEEPERVETNYVDSQRAAAVMLGNQDIKKDLKVKKKHDRADAQTSAAFEDLDYDTYLLQGEHKLRAGDAQRALMYLSSACEISPETESEAFILRSRCYAQLGLYARADEDADAYLKKQPNNIRGLMNKAESQYNLGRFEHAMKYYFRANRVRPDYPGIRDGVTKCREAIDNSLARSNGFSFASMSHVIRMIEDAERSEAERADLVKRMRLGHVSSSGGSLTREDEDNNNNEGAAGSNNVVNKAVKDKEEETSKAMQLDFASIPEFAGLWNPAMEVMTRSSTTEEERNIRRSNGSTTEEDRDRRRRRQRDHALRSANQHLLGELHADQVYLQALGSSKLLGKDDKDGLKQAVTACVSEALTYLEARKEFWQQQKPVYARRSEIARRTTSAKAAA